MHTYEIIIKDQTKGSNVPNGVPNPNTPNQSSVADTEPIDNVAEDKGFEAKAVAKVGWDMVNTLVVSKVGELYGDSLLQQKINAVGSMVSIGMSFVVNPALGAVHLATSVSSQIIDASINVTKQTMGSAVSLQRAGYLNRSRD